MPTWGFEILSISQILEIELDLSSNDDLANAILFLSLNFTN